MSLLKTGWPIPSWIANTVLLFLLPANINFEMDFRETNTHGFSLYMVSIRRMTSNGEKEKSSALQTALSVLRFAKQSLFYRIEV